MNNSISTRAGTTVDDLFWQAICNRDQQFEGVFVFAVRTTGVFCRPTCPSRRANRNNVLIFSKGQKAEKAGYRACKRCHPTLNSIAERQHETVKQACRIIEFSEQVPGLQDLADRFEMSRFHFQRQFKKIMGVTPKDYAVKLRTERLSEGLTQEKTITAAMYSAGYNASSRFYTESRQFLGMSPTAFRNGGAGMTIQFAVGQSTLGVVLVAATKIGVCAISLGDDPDGMARDLRDQFPNATITAGDKDFHRWVIVAVGLVEVPAQTLCMPLDIRGTAFQMQVWKALQTIPVGSTVTYSELAERIGKPLATRAVATACATNPVAIAIPCHRVVRKDQSLSGYRWGVERKRELLRRESPVTED